MQKKNKTSETHFVPQLFVSFFAVSFLFEQVVSRGSDFRSKAQELIEPKTPIPGVLFALNVAGWNSF